MPLIMLLRIVIMSMVWSLYNIIHEHVARGGELHVSLNKRAVHPTEDCSAVDSTVESVKSECWMLF